MFARMRMSSNDAVGRIASRVPLEQLQVCEPFVDDRVPDRRRAGQRFDRVVNFEDQGLGELANFFEAFLGPRPGDHGFVTLPQGDAERGENEHHGRARDRHHRLVAGCQPAQHVHGRRFARDDWLPDEKPLEIVRQLPR